MSRGKRAGASSDAKFMSAWAAVRELVDDFLTNKDHYISGQYQEAEARTDFIDKFFTAIGWDVSHERERDPYRQEVKIEKTTSPRSAGRADYSFSLAPLYQKPRFLVEAKRPQPKIDTPDNCFQIIRYSWPQRLPIAVLTDFYNFHVVDSRFRPNINSAASRVVKTWNCAEFRDQDKFAELYWLVSREAVLDESIERFAAQSLPSQQVATRQYNLFASEVREFDDDFLAKLDEWREQLAADFKRADSSLTSEQLTEIVQRVIDRLIFTRFLEDKQIEERAVILRFGQGGRTHWADFVSASKRLDQIYNGIVFKQHHVLDSPYFQPDSVAFSEICDELTDEHSPYNFASIPVEILGRIYERFLGKIVLSKKNTISVVEKEDVRKAGGVYYTPDYIVTYMVENSLGKLVEGKKPSELLALRIIDTSCGSGSFLIGVFTVLMQSALSYLRLNPNGVPKQLAELRDGEFHLSMKFKRELLLTCIYGVDIDAQAAEVAQLSLYLKLLEDETTFSAKNQQLEMGVALLPSLNKNIVVANALITLDEKSDLFSIERLNELKALDFTKVFSHVFESGGFDLVIGNPPYIKEYVNREAFDHIRNSPYYQGKMDIWYLFASRGIDWLKQKTGKLAFIATNNWVTNFGARGFRRKLVAEMRIDQLIDFGNFKVFRDAGIQTMILIATKRKVSKKYAVDFRRLVGDKPSIEDAHALLLKTSGKGQEFLTPMLEQKSSQGEALTFSDGLVEKLLEKIEAKKNFAFDGKSEIAQGIVAPQDSLNKAGQLKLGKGARVGEGIFVLSASEKRKLALTKDEIKILRPYFTSNELHKYAATKKNQYWIIYTDSEFRSAKKMAPFPNLKRHLDRFAKVITSHNKPYGLHRARDERFFVGEKIMVLRKCIEPCFTFTDFPCYVSQTYNVIKTDRANLLYLTGLLNSHVVQFWLRYRGKMQGSHFQLDKEPLLGVPVHLPSKKEQDRIAIAVQRLIDCRREATSAETEAARDRYERLAIQIEDELQREFEELYGLDEQDRMTLTQGSHSRRQIGGAELEELELGE